MRVKYLAQEHNAVPRPGLEPGPFNPESSALTIRPLRLPHNGTITDGIEGLVLTYTEPGSHNYARQMQPSVTLSQRWLYSH